ncbi:MAG: photosystem II reaction center protein PsbN, partial [Symploca sp. SIO2E9]|nr:photosystem II reaction center protein PsbN [Symploca sp. SIO2E9]
PSAQLNDPFEDHED